MTKMLAIEELEKKLIEKTDVDVDKYILEISRLEKTIDEKIQIIPHTQ